VFNTAIFNLKKFVRPLYIDKSRLIKTELETLSNILLDEVTLCKKDPSQRLESMRTTSCVVSQKSDIMFSLIVVCACNEIE
jgi:hypothetical protein